MMSEQEAEDSANMPQDQNLILGSIQDIKTQIAGGTNILNEIRKNEENFVHDFNKKQEIEATLSNREELQNSACQIPYYEPEAKENLAALESILQENKRNFQVLVQNFKQTITTNLNSISILQGQIIEKLKVWKHEQQQMANGIPKGHFIDLDRLQLWCEELAELIWKSYEQLKESECMLLQQHGTTQTDNSTDLTFVQNCAEKFLRLLQDLLNHSLIVEEQPPQLIKMKTEFPKTVVVCLLVGKRLNVHLHSPELSAFIINEDQARSLPVTSDNLETIGEITDGKVMMSKSGDDDFKRIIFSFRSMKLNTIKRCYRRGGVNTERLMEVEEAGGEKLCFYFECVVTVGPLKFKVWTISLPVIVIRHGSQKALAVASIIWDNAFGEIGRVPFKVPSTASWDDVAQILSAKFFQLTGRGLTDENLSCLAKKAFRNRHPQPETISWSKLCKDLLPERNFTFWHWFHAALKLIEKKETHLKDLWKRGLIMGFIERKVAEDMLSQCETGTFLLRFADIFQGAITIVVVVKPGIVVSLHPFQFLDLQNKKISMSIKHLEKLKFLYQPNRSIPKWDAFGDFYDDDDDENDQASSEMSCLMDPHVNIMLTGELAMNHFVVLTESGVSFQQFYCQNRRQGGTRNLTTFHLLEISSKSTPKVNDWFHNSFHLEKTNLQSLSVDWDYHESPAEGISPLYRRHSESLEKLHIFCSPFYDNFYLKFSSMTVLPNLVEIELWGNVSKNLDFLRYMPALKILKWNTRCYDDSIFGDLLQENLGKQAYLQYTEKIVENTTKLGEDSFRLCYLHTFEIDWGFISSRCWERLGKWMPNMKSLKGSVGGDDQLAVIAKQWLKIEQVELAHGSEVSALGIMEAHLQHQGFKCLKRFTWKPCTCFDFIYGVDEMYAENELRKNAGRNVTLPWKRHLQMDSNVQKTKCKQALYEVALIGH